MVDCTCALIWKIKDMIGMGRGPRQHNGQGGML